MELWQLRCKLRYHFSRQERAAMKGKLPMTEALFWKCLNTCWKRFDMQTFWELWHQYPGYIQRRKAQAQTRLQDETEKAYWKDLKNRLDEYMSESPLHIHLL